MLSVDGVPPARSGLDETARPRPTARRAVGVARRLQDDIVESGVQAGTVFGSQQDLRGRYKVGDDTLREAIRILEFNGVALMRSGPGGGLMICRPPLSLVVASVVGHLYDVPKGESVEARLDQVSVARATLAVTVARLIAAAGDGECPARLRKGVERHDSGDTLIAMAEALADPCLVLAARCLHSLAYRLLQAGRAVARGSQPAPPAGGSMAETALELVANVHASDAVARAVALVRPTDSHRFGCHLDDPFLSCGSPLNRSRVGQVVRMIAMEMKSGVLAKYLGSEDALRERYKASRATIRQALYVLEDAGIVAARRGRSKGWFACTLVPAIPFRQVGHYLASIPVAAADVRRSASSWRQEASGVAANPFVEFLLRTLDAYADAVQPGRA